MRFPLHDPNDEGAILSRRSLLMGGAALGTASVIGLPVTPAMGSVEKDSRALPREGQIPADQMARNAMVRRMRLRTDHGDIFWYYRGMTYAQRGLELIPMSELVYLLMNRVSPTADGGLSIQSFELSFRTAPGSAKRAEQIYNPITDQMVDVPYTPIGPTVSNYDAQNQLNIGAELGGSQLELNYQPEIFYQIDEEISFQRHTQARIKTPGKPDRVLNEMSMIASPTAEALDQSRSSASARAYASDVSDFARWMRMPEGVGNQTLRSAGKKYSSFEHVPADWRTMLAEMDPDLAADPMSAFDREQARYRN